MHNLVAAFDGVLMRVGLDLADNERAIALYRRFRFQVEGILRHYAFNQGRYMDAHVMGRINGQARPEPT